MAKTKRKHLADLDAKKKQRPLAQHSVKSDPMVEDSQALPPSTKQGNTLKTEASSTFPSREQPKYTVTCDREGGPIAESSHTSSSSQKAGHEVEQNVKPAPVAPSMQPNGDESDSNSWVEVKKQRIIIIIPPLPKAKPKLPNTDQLENLRKGDPQRKYKAVLHQDRAKEKATNTNMYGKRTWKSAIRTLETESTVKELMGRHVRENRRIDVPPISSMDILLASALDTDHALCTPWREKSHHHTDLLPTRTEEKVSLDTADSSAQPKRSSFKATKGLKVPVRNNKAGHAMKRRISLCKSAHPNTTRKCAKPEQAVNDVREKQRKYKGSNPPVLSSSQAIKVVTLKKHLEKAGGLRNWLCSVGLGQFKEAFEKRMWNEIDLLQLQMDDLKKMGKPAVGPRRKLIWALNHLSQQII